MEIFLFFFFILIFIFFSKSASSGSSYSRNIDFKNDQERQNWQEEIKTGTTSLAFGDWKIAKAKEASMALIDQERVLFNQLIERGKELQHVKRHGTLRTFNARPFTSDLAKALGIHPEEADLINREETAQGILDRGFIKVIGSPLGPPRLQRANNGITPSTQEEKDLATQELNKIDYEWSALNIRMLDDFFSDEVKNVSRDDFVLEFRAPEKMARFPYTAGQWIAKSKRFGVKSFDGNISAIWGSGFSKNQAIALALENITLRKNKHNDIVPVPFDPMDADL